MSTSSEAGAASGPAAAVGSTRPWPTPWTTPEDREGWEVVARGEGRHDLPPVRTSIIISMDPDQADWVEDAAAAAGLAPEEFVLRLINEARHRT
ncbi:MAG: hypothetical protein ACRDJN_21880 [Chloroflexota bacterium]